MAQHSQRSMPVIDALGATGRPLPRETFGALLLAGTIGFSGFYSGTAGELPLLLWCALCCVLWGWVSPRRAEGLPSSGWVALFALAWCIVAWRASIAPSFSLAGVWGVMLLPLAVVATSASRRPSIALAVALVAGAALVMLSFPGLLGPRQPQPFALGDPNNVSTLTNLVWIPVAMALLAADGERRWPLVALVVLGFLATIVLLSSGSRAGIALGLAAAVCILLLAVHARRERAAGALLLGALLSAIPGSTTDQAQSLAIAQEFVDVGNSGFALRFWLIEAALALFASAPLTGTGPRTFHLLYERLRAPEEQKTAGVFVHNDWVQLPQEFGLPMLLVLLVLLIWLLRRALGGLRAFLAAPRGSQEASRFTELGLVLAVGTALVHALVNFTLYCPAIALLLGVMVGAMLRREPGRSAGARPFLAGWVLATLMLFPLAVDAVSAAAFMGHRGFPGLTASPQPREALAQTLRMLAPDDSIPPFYLARLRLIQAARAEDADSRRYALATVVQYYEEAMARDPWNIDVQLAYAELLTQLGGSLAISEDVTRTDVALLEGARRRNPDDSRLLFALADRYAALGRSEDEQALLDGWLAYCGVHWRREPQQLERAIVRARALGMTLELPGLCTRPIPELGLPGVSGS